MIGLLVTRIYDVRCRARLFWFNVLVIMIRIGVRIQDRIFWFLTQ